MKAIIIRTGTALAAMLVSSFGEMPAVAQSIEPRAYSAAPVGTNFAIVAYSEAHGALPVDTALPLSDIDLEVRSVFIGFARSLDLWGRSGKVDFIIPYGKLAGDAVYKGEPVERRVSGFGDAAARLTILLHGAPAMAPAEFRTYRQDLLVGASVQLFIPTGQYDDERLLNLGTNRWAIKPELGVSKAWGRWTLEGAAGATFFGANERFFGDRKRSQKPIYSGQAHLICNLSPGTWVAANLSWFAGGRTSVDGVDDSNLQNNWRAGVIGAVPLNRRFSLKANASKGVSARTGNNFDLYGIALQYRWGAGS